jgi:integrase
LTRVWYSPERTAVRSTLERSRGHSAATCSPLEYRSSACTISGTHATLALAAGVHPKVVQERLGHANIAITLDTYSHAVPALEEEAARTVAALVFGQ